ncbi:MAG: CRISPR system precrRNA processing endoribonuclease RAMP protein Cas6 [Zestosphaera sp.]
MERHLFKATVTIRESVANAKRPKDLERVRGEGVFTGKLVKSLVIDGNPLLKSFFEKVSGSAPKLIHVSPLYIERVINGRKQVKCIHRYGDVYSNRTAKYCFYVGLVESSVVRSPTSDEVYRALLDLSGCHQFRTHVLHVELLSVEAMDVAREARKVMSYLNTLGKVKVVFSSPTLLRDPFRGGKHKSLIPTPINMFSTPVYINLFLTGKFRQRTLTRMLITLHRLLNEPYSIYKTVRVMLVKYHEDKNPIPALIGYVNLFLNRHYYEQYVSRGIDLGVLLEETFSTMLTLGTGTSRATGFGHITITTPTSGS